MAVVRTPLPRALAEDFRYRSALVKLLLRPGARFACHGDGLCCTDLHVIGPLGRADVARARRSDPEAVVLHQGLRMLSLRTEAGACLFRTQYGCSIHAAPRERARPTACRRFPFEGVRTDAGIRVTTEHRCPCRTMGARPPIDEDVARASLVDAGGRLRIASRVARVPLTRRSRVGLGRWARIEATILARLAAGEGPEEVLEAEPFAPLAGIEWRDVGHHLRSRIDGTKGGEALAWAGDAILGWTGAHRSKGRTRPWKESFDRAEARSSPGDPGAIVADWIADVVWDLSWAEIVSFDVLRSELATRLAIVRWVSARLLAEGARPDRAAAEAVMIGEVTGATSVWDSVRAALVVSARRRG